MKNKYSLYENWQKVQYLNRQNRFVMDFEKDGSKLSAYVPNTGRMTEFRFEGHPFYLAPVQSKKFNFRVVATKYQNSYVILDTVKVNDIFQELLNHNFIPEFENIKSIRREYTIGNSRFDFLISTQKDQKVLIEIKSCTLCHNGVAMFPDAPTKRGRKHIRQLNELAEQGYKSYVYYLVLNKSAKYFIPDFHIDFQYGKTFLKASNVNFKALRLHIADPVSIDLAATQAIPVKKSIVNRHCTKKGSYILVMENEEDAQYAIGAQGIMDFPQGFYVYVGSAMTNLNKRIKRHKRKRKKTHWHIDHLTGGEMEIVEDYRIRRSDRIESQLSKEIETLAGKSIAGFGASDTENNSHLHYFPRNPVDNQKFYSIILDYMTSMKARD
jgi:sugar fermentation stimulation protein A